MLRRGLVLAQLGVVAVLAFSPAADDPKEIYKQTLRGTVFIETNGGGFGTGWIADRERRLIITNYHVVLKDATVNVVFPFFKNGELVVEKTGYRSVTRYKAKVIDSLIDKDLAAIQLEDPLPEGPAALKMSERGTEAAERVHSLGNPAASRGHWVYTSGVVRQVFEDRWHYVHTHARIKQNCVGRIMQTQSPINEGDSGGPVVNDRGEVVATTSGYTREARIITNFIDISEVRPFVIQARRVADPKTAADYILRGERLIRRDRYTDAAASFAQAIKLDPKSAAAHRGRGQAFYENGDYDTALVDLDKAIELDAADALSFYYRAAAHHFNDKPDQAMKDATKAISLDPKCALAYNLRGVIYDGKGELARAVADYSRAIEIDPTDAIYWSNRADTNVKLKEYDQAIRDAQSAMLIDPFNADAWTARGQALRHKKDHDGQVENFKDALKFLPDSAALWCELGDALTWKSEWASSVGAYGKAIQLDPKNAYAHWSRANSLEELERVNDAQADYQKAVELDPDYKDQLSSFETAYVRVHNDTNQTLRIWVQYEYKTKDGKWVLHPADPAKAPSWTFKPGEKFRLEEDQWVIHCRRCRIWAVGVGSDDAWDKYKTAFWELVPRTGYQAQSRPVFTMRFFQ